MHTLSSLWALALYAYAHREEVGAAIMAAMLAWIPIASVLAHFVPRPEPASGWRNALKRALYDLFVDTPATRAALGRIGIFGGKWNLPGIPSRTPDANPPKASAPTDLRVPPATLLLPLAFIAFGSMALGCAHGTDGLRQTCTNTDKVLTGLYSTSAALYSADQKALRAKITHDTADAIGATAAQHTAAYDKLLAGLDAAQSDMDVTCDAADEIDAGAKKDLAGMISHVGQIGADIAAAVADFKKALTLFETSQLFYRTGGAAAISAAFIAVPGLPEVDHVIYGMPLLEAIEPGWVNVVDPVVAKEVR